MIEPNAPGEQRVHQESSSEDESESVDRAARMTTHDWCKCGQCDASSLAGEIQCVCCVERLTTKSHASWWVLRLNKPLN